ncbi:MAG: DNA-formamidopyrimidine glycosylase family protein, partial [Patescibacteria group bacterium]
MPELPEVQTVVDDLNRKVVGRKITGVWLDWPKMVKDPLDQSRNRIAHKHVAEFEKSLKGKKILKAARKAKNILIYLSAHPSRKATADKGGLLLLIHQKMTGHMLVGRWNVKCQRSNVKCKVIPLEPRAAVTDPYNRFIHLILYLDDGRMLALSDLRKFAKAILGPVEQIENLPELKNLGPDALDSKLTYPKFAEIIKNENRKIKQVLMDQEVIAGIG